MQRDKETLVREIGRLEAALARRERQLSSYDREADRGQLLTTLGTLVMLSGILVAVFVNLGGGALGFAVGVFAVVWGGFLHGVSKEDMEDIEQEVEDLRVELGEHRALLLLH